MTSAMLIECGHSFYRLQLQTVLRFEILSVLQQGDQSLTEEDDKLNEVDIDLLYQ